MNEKMANGEGAEIVFLNDRLATCAAKGRFLHGAASRNRGEGLRSFAIRRRLAEIVNMSKAMRASRA